MTWLRGGESDLQNEPDDPQKAVPVPYMPGFDEPLPLHEEPTRLNVKAVLVILLVLGCFPAAYFPYTHYQNQIALRTTLAEVERLADEGKADQALSRVSGLLADWPNDIEALEIHARLLTEIARTPEQYLDAARAQDQLIRLDPKGPGRQENRARLVELYVAYADATRRASTRRETTTDKYESRYRAAVKMAQQRMVLGADDAESHRLLGRALEGLALTGDAQALVDSTTEYEIALERDHRDAAAAEHLAMMSLERRNEPIIAERILDRVVLAAPNSVDARLARHRFFLKTHQEDRAKIDLEAAIRLKPTDLRVQLTAAGDAIRRRDPTAARDHLDAIAENQRQDRRALILRRQIDLIEEHPEQAIDEWRKSLALFEANDLELSSRLAHSLILLGRIEEAGRLIDQFERTENDSAKATARFLKGLLDERTGRTASAIANLESARLTIDEPTLVDVELALGRCYETFNDHQKAQTCYQRAVEAVPLSSNAQRALAREIGRKSMDKAAEQLEAAHSLIPSDPWILADLATIRLIQQKSLPTAARDPSVVKELIDRADRLGLEDLTVLKLRADSLALAQGLDRVIALYEEASHGPLARREGLWQAWALVLIQLGRTGEAIALLEKASHPELAGDHASFRSIRARILAREGHGQEARKVLDEQPQNVRETERAALAIARGDLLQFLGEIREARAACVDWARIDKLDPRPGLKMLTLAQVDGDESEESVRSALSMLEALGGVGEPYPLAAQALNLIYVTGSNEVKRAAHLEKAEELSQKLSKIAPLLPITAFLRGKVLERSDRIEEAIVDYRKAIRGETASMALTQLVSLLGRLKHYRELVSLKREFGTSEPVDHFSASTYFELGDYEAASKLVNQFVENSAEPTPMRVLQAGMVRDLGQPTEITSTLRGLIDRDKNRPEPWLALVMFQMSQGLKEEANKMVARAIASYQGEQPEAFIARCRWLAGNRREAARLFNDAVGRNPDDLGVLKLATEFAEASGLRVEAEKLLRQVLKINPSLAWASRRLARLLSSRGDRQSWDEAWTFIAADPTQAEDVAQVRSIRAMLLERSPYSARRAEALAAWKALAEDFPTTNRFAGDARVHLARTYLESGDPTRAARVIEPVAIGRNSFDPVVLAILVEALARSGQVAEAEAKLNRLVALDMKSPETACARAWVEQARDRKAEATSTLEEAFAQSVDSPDASTVGVAIVRQLLGLAEFDVAERMAALIGSKSPDKGWLLGLVQMRAGRFTQALETLRASLKSAAAVGREASSVLIELANATRVDEATRHGACSIAESLLSNAPADPALVELVASQLHKDGKFDDESRLYERAIHGDPTLEAAWNGLALVVGESLGRPGEALGKIDEAIRLCGRKPSYCETRGIILTRLGKLDEAIVDLEVAVADQPTAVRLFHLARACLKANQAERFAKYRDLAREAKLDPATLDPKERADYPAVMGP